MYSSNCTAVRPTISVTKLNIAARLPIGYQGSGTLDPLSRDGLRSGRFVERNSPERGSVSCRPECPGRAVAVGEDINQGTLFFCQAGGDRCDVVTFLAERAGLSVAA